MPVEKPSEQFSLVELVCESELVVLVEFALEIDQFSARLVDSERWRDVVVDDDGDAAVGVDCEEPILLLLVCRDLDQAEVVAWSAIFGLEFFEENLDLLAVGGVCGEEMKTFGVLDILRGAGLVVERHSWLRLGA